MVIRVARDAVKIMLSREKRQKEVRATPKILVKKY
jgi:hypothetical protein